MVACSPVVIVDEGVTCRPELGAELAGGLVTDVRVDRHRARDDVVEQRIDARHELRRAPSVLGALLEEQLADAVRLVGERARQRLEHRHTERVDVGAQVERVSARLLR